MGNACKACDNQSLPLIVERNHTAEIKKLIEDLRKKHEIECKESK